MLIATVVFLYIIGVPGDQCDYFRLAEHALADLELQTVLDSVALSAT